jgi:hypothetical protein
MRADVKAQPGKELMLNESLPTRDFREHTDLNQLKRQAKELLDAFRGGEPSAAAEVNAHYRSADPGSFALHDAPVGFGARLWVSELAETESLRGRE